LNHLAWIASLPKLWKVKPLRAVADCMVSNVDKLCMDNEESVRLCNYMNVYHNEFITLSMDFMRATATRREVATYCLKSGDVIITKDSETWEDIGVPALVRETANDLVCGYHLALIRPSSKITGAFLLRCFQAESIAIQLELAANGVTRFGLPKSEILSFMLPIPPLVDQKTIADYLDRETKRIDALIVAKERMLDLLNEKRQALITHSIVRSFDSCISAKRLKYVVRLRRSGTQDHVGRSYVGLKDIESWTGQLLRSAEDSNDCMSVMSVGSNFESGDVVFGKLRSYLCKAWIAEFQGQSSTEFLVMEPLEVESRFLLYVCLSQYFVELVNSATFGSKMPRADWTFMGSIRIPVLKRDEQQDIVTQIDREIVRIEKLRFKTEHSIGLLKERRTALITAAVTGQIDVEEMAA